MLKKIMAVLLAFILAAGGWVYWLWSRIDINEYFNPDKPVETVGRTEPSSNGSETENTEIAGPGVIEEQVQEQLENEELKQPGELSDKELEEAVVHKYRTAFATLKKGYEAQVNNLIHQAAEEYGSMSEQDKKTAMWTLGLKYLKLGKALEDACDTSFYKVLDQMKQELEDNNLSTDFVQEAEKQYEQEKKERSEYLMDKALGQIN